MKALLLGILATASLSHLAWSKPHVVFLTLDDLSRSSVGVYGCTLPEITPNLDRIAQEGMRFDHFHMVATNCTPSRSHMMTGQYQQKNLVLSLGKEGAGNHANRFTMPAIFRDAGYHTGIMGKNSHQMPFEPHSAWDIEYGSYGSTRVPEAIYEQVKAAIANAEEQGKPLFFNLNLYDPHTDLYGWNGQTGPKEEKTNHPSRIYQADEIAYPDFFPPIPKAAETGTTRGGTPNISMRQELAAYFNSVKRADDSVGAMIRAFGEAGILDNTMIVAISDHGMQQPGAKTTLYHEGTVSPLMVRWPGNVAAGSIEGRHMVSALDLLPTFCEVLEVPIPADLDGRSFLPMLKGEQPQQWRDFVYMQQNDRNKGRAIQTTDWLYTINPWSDGTTKFGSVSTGMHCWKLLKEASERPDASDLLKQWTHRIEYRSPEELFDIKNDPQCLHNLATDPNHKETKLNMRAKMLAEAKISNDHWVIDCIENPTDPTIQAQTVAAIEDFRENRSSLPTASRLVHYDPHDGWMEINNTLFEDGDKWGIWTPSNEDAAMKANHGAEGCGQHAILFTQAGAIETHTAIDASVFSKLKIQFLVPKGQEAKNKRQKSKPGPVLGRTSSLLVEYAGPNGDWHLAAKLNHKQLSQPVELIIPAPNEGFPESTKVRLRAALKEGESFALDGLRFTGQQDWQIVNTGRARAFWKAAKDTAFQGRAFTLTTGDGNEVVQKQPLANGDIGELEIRYQFEAKDIGTNDRLILETHADGHWTTLAAHDYSYILLPEKHYSHLVTLSVDYINRMQPSQFRFRFEADDDTAQVSITDFTLKTRKPF